MHWVQALVGVIAVLEGVAAWVGDAAEIAERVVVVFGGLIVELFIDQPILIVIGESKAFMCLIQRCWAALRLAQPTVLCNITQNRGEPYMSPELVRASSLGNSSLQKLLQIHCEMKK